MENAIYDTDLTDARRAVLKPLLPGAARRGRPQKDRRNIVSAILYIAKEGCSRRGLPKDFGPWKTAYHVFRRWRDEGGWKRLCKALRRLVRRQAGKEPAPAGCILDSQSVKSAPRGGETGCDAGKRIKGRKRHILVDTLGLPLCVHVTPASTPEREGGLGLLRRLGGAWHRLRKLWADAGCSGPDFAEKVRGLRERPAVEVVRRSAGQKGFAVLPRRRVVERTFGWLMRHRRLARDYERTPASAEAFIYIAMIRVQLRRLAR